MVGTHDYQPPMVIPLSSDNRQLPMVIPQGLDGRQLPMVIPQGLDGRQLPMVIPQGLDDRQLPMVIPQGLDGRQLPMVIPQGLDSRQLPVVIPQGLDDRQLPVVIPQGLDDRQLPMVIPQDMDNPQIHMVILQGIGSLQLPLLISQKTDVLPLLLILHKGLYGCLLAMLLPHRMYGRQLPVVVPLDADKNDSVITINCTPLAWAQIMEAIEKGRIPFAQTTEGFLLLLLLLNSFNKKITSFTFSAKGDVRLNYYFPGFGGLPSLAWRIWKIACKFPDSVGELTARIPASLFSPDVSFDSLDQSIKELIMAYEALQRNKGKVTMKVSKPRQKILKMMPGSKSKSTSKNKHNEEAFEKLIRMEFGSGLVLKEVIEAPPGDKDAADILVFESCSSGCKCPKCGVYTTKKAQGGPSNKPRVFWDLPIRNGVPCQVHIYGQKKYECTNPECPQRAFLEQFVCVSSMKRFSLRLTSMVLSMAALTSYHGEECMWKLCGIRISDDTIRKLVMSLVFPDDPNTRMIGIDDVCKRKGMSYYTVIYSLEDHRLLAIVDGRDGVELKKWLDQHTKVRLICRDRGSAYSKTIEKWASEHNCEVVEVADRFHLIQNVIDHLKAHCLSDLPLKICIIEEGDNVKLVEGDDIPHKKAYATAPKPTAEQLASLNFDNSPPMDANGNPIEFEMPSTNASAQNEETTKVTEAETKNETDTTAATEEEPKILDEKARRKIYEHYNNVVSIRRDFKALEPTVHSKKERYRQLALQYGLPFKEIGHYCRMNEKDVIAILHGLPKPVSECDEKQSAEGKTEYALATEIRKCYNSFLPRKQEYKRLATLYGTDETTIGRYCRMTEEQLEALKGKSPDEYTQAIAIRNSYRPLPPKKELYKQLATQYGVDVTLVSRYCRMTAEDVEALKNHSSKEVLQQRSKKDRKKKTKTIDSYKYIIYKMLSSGHNIGDTFWYVKEKGCPLVDESLIKSIRTIYEMIYPNKLLPDIKDYLELKYDTGVHVIRRCELLKYLVTVNPKVKRREVLVKYESLIYEKYPSVRNLRNIFMDFHSAIMGDDETSVDRFIEKYKGGKLAGFCKSLQHDIEAVKNAVRYVYSSGFVEGNNAKFKCLKRISSGRLQINSLSQKCKLGFWSTLEDFSLKDVAPQFMNVGTT